jgi:hypothetical protein
MHLETLKHFFGMHHTPVCFQSLLFVAGFALLSLEVLGVRILAPYVGTTIPVWASLIGVTLLAGAIGYFAGGLLADRAQNRIHFLTLALSSSILIGLTPFIREGIGFFASDVPYALGALLGSFMLLLLPAIFLSMLITYVIRLQVTSLNMVGQMHGDLYAIATLGSIAGIFGTSYVLVPFYTVPHIIWGLSACVLVAGICAMKA